MASNELHRLWHGQNGRCFYCDGPAYLPSHESRDQARSRLHIASGSGGAKKLLNQHEATIDRATRKMVCKFCNCQRGSRSVETHRIAMKAKVAADTHPVNRLVEIYAQGRLGWRPLATPDNAA